MFAGANNDYAGVWQYRTKRCDGDRWFCFPVMVIRQYCRAVLNRGDAYFWAQQCGDCFCVV